MNMGYEDDDLKPYIEPEAEYNDLRRIGEAEGFDFPYKRFRHVLVQFNFLNILGYFTETLAGMGYNKSDIEESLKTQKYDDLFATYLLLGRRSSDVSQCQYSGLFLILNHVFMEKCNFYSNWMF